MFAIAGQTVVKAMAYRAYAIRPYNYRKTKIGIIYENYLEKWRNFIWQFGALLFGNLAENLRCGTHNMELRMQFKQ